MLASLWKTKSKIVEDLLKRPCTFVGPSSFVGPSMLAHLGTSFLTWSRNCTLYTILARVLVNVSKHFFARIMAPCRALLHWPSHEKGKQKYKSSGIDKFKNFISDFWNYDQKMQNKISGGLLAKIFEIRARLVRTFPTSNISISEQFVKPFLFRYKNSGNSSVLRQWCASKPEISDATVDL